jgi:hypothetical protein
MMHRRRRDRDCRPGLTCRGQQEGSPCQARSMTRSAAAPASGACLVHVWSTRHRSRAVRNGLQRSPAVGRSRRSQARSCRNRTGGRTLIRMRSQGSSPGVPLSRATRCTCTSVPGDLTRQLAQNRLTVALPPVGNVPAPARRTQEHLTSWSSDRKDLRFRGLLGFLWVGWRAELASLA